MEKLEALFNTIRENEQIAKLVTLVIGIIVILLITGAIRRFVVNRISNTDQKYRGRKAFSFLGYFLIVAFALFVYSDKIGNIGVAIGLVGAGVAFALQEVITSFAAWISIMFSDTVKVGQRIKVGEISGDIIDIGMLKTTIMEVGDWVKGDLYNGRITVIPNSYIFKDALRNYSSDYPFLWDEITVPIRTESDYKLAKEVFTEIATDICGDYAQRSKATWQKMRNKYRVEDAEVEPMVTLQFDENWITFTIRYIVDYRKRRSTKDKLFMRLLEEIDKYDNIIMIAATSMEVRNIPSKD